MKEQRHATRTARSWGSLSREEIVSAALDIASSEGVQALSMRHLADRLGASRMSLYRHVADKEALLDLTADAIAERHIKLPEASPEQPWSERLRQLAYLIRDQLQAYPGLADLVITRGNRGISGLHLAEYIVAMMYEAGLTESGVAVYYQVFIDVVIGRIHRELSHDPADPQRMARLLDFAANQQTDEFDSLRRTDRRLREVTPDDVFEKEVDILIAAIGAAGTVTTVHRDTSPD